MATRFASSKGKISFCDLCGQRYDLDKLKKIYIMGKLINTKRCPECWDPDHPQNFIPILAPPKLNNDPQALREPRPDTNRNDSCSDFAFAPVASQQLTLYLNNVQITAFTSVVPGVVIVPPLPGNAIL